MLINCPKCGFSQPQDKYCAQCGLDIENYRPPQTPLFRRIVTNPFFHLLLVLVIALAAGTIAFKRQKKEIQERVNFFGQNIQYNRAAPQNTAPPSETEGQVPLERAEDIQTDMAATELPIPPSATATGRADIPPPPPPPQDPANNNLEAANQKTPATNVRLRIQYVEVNIPVLDQIYLDSRQGGLFNSLGDHVAGVWPQGRSKANQFKAGWRVLTKEEKIIELGEPQQFFVGLKGNDPENDLGLTTYFEVSGVDTQGLHGQMEIVRAWRETAPDGTSTIQRRFYPGSLDISTDAYFFLVGVLPRASAMEKDPYLTNIEPFKILKSNYFKNRQTEFIILIDFDR